jgi:hypothetical protein
MKEYKQRINVPRFAAVASPSSLPGQRAKADSAEILPELILGPGSLIRAFLFEARNRNSSPHGSIDPGYHAGTRT